LAILAMDAVANGGGIAIATWGAVALAQIVLVILGGQPNYFLFTLPGRLS